jgi:hypothetical protein
MNGGKKHTAFYLYWRDYHPSFAWRTRQYNSLDGYKLHEGPRLRKKYVPKKNVAEVQRNLAIYKGMTISRKMTYEQQEEFYYAYPNVEGEDYLIQAYLHFANPNARKWMDYDSEKCMESSGKNG